MESKNQIVIVAEQSGLEKNKVQDLLNNFNTFFSEAKSVAEKSRTIVVTDETQVNLMKEARDNRLKLKKIRVDVENTRKKLKEQSLREGKAIDGIANIIKALVVPVEEHLEKQEKFIEIIEVEKKAKRLADRTAKLSQYVADISLYNLNDMSDEAFNNLFTSSKKAFEDQKAAELKAEAEKAEEERKDKLESARKLELAPYIDYSKLTVDLRTLPEKEYQAILLAAKSEKAERDAEQEKIRLENEKLKKEREEREKQIAKEKAAKEKEIEKERLAREKELAEERKKQEEKLKKEREEREKLEKKLQAEREEKERAIKEEEEKKRKALLAPDKTKLLDFAIALEKIELPNVKSREAGKVIDEAQTMILKVASFVREKAKAF